MRSGPWIRGVLFDWDGTLLDSCHADTQAYLKMFRALGVAWGTTELDRHYSPDWHRVYRAARIPRRRWEEADRLWARFYRYEKPALLPGARRVLRALDRRYVLGLVTSGSRARVTRQLRRFGLAGLFSACVCCEDAARRKPHPAPLLEALRRLKLPAEACFYVGDSPEDVEMSRRARVRAVAVPGAFRTRARLRAARPHALLASLIELPGFLRSV